MTTSPTACLHCGAEIELHFPMNHRSSRYAFWRHLATQRRACLAGRTAMATPAPSPAFPSPWVTTDEPCPSGHADCTVDCGSCKGTGKKVVGRKG